MLVADNNNSNCHILVIRCIQHSENCTYFWIADVLEFELSGLGTVI